MNNLLKNIAFCFFLLLFLQACASEKSGSPSSESMESTESTTSQDEEDSKKDELGKEQAEDANPNLESKPLQQIIVPEQEFTIEKIAISREKSSESEQLSISNKHAKVLLFAKKLQKGSYPIAKNSLPYATVHVTLTQEGNNSEKIEGDLENGIVKLVVLDSAGITKGSFEGTLIKNNERYFIGGNFSN